MKTRRHNDFLEETAKRWVYLSSRCGHQQREERLPLPEEDLFLEDLNCNLQPRGEAQLRKAWEGEQLGQTALRMHGAACHDSSPLIRRWDLIFAVFVLDVQSMAHMFGSIYAQRHEMYANTHQVNGSNGLATSYQLEGSLAHRCRLVALQCGEGDCMQWVDLDFFGSWLPQRCRLPQQRCSQQPSAQHRGPYHA